MAAWIMYGPLPWSVSARSSSSRPSSPLRGGVVKFVHREVNRRICARDEPVDRSDTGLRLGQRGEPPLTRDRQRASRPRSGRTGENERCNGDEKGQDAARTSPR